MEPEEQDDYCEDCGRWLGRDNAYEHPYMEFLCIECGTEAELELEED